MPYINTTERFGTEKGRLTGRQEGDLTPTPIFTNLFGLLIIILTFYPVFFNIAYMTKQDLIISHLIFIILFCFSAKYVLSTLFHNKRYEAYKKTHDNHHPLLLVASWLITIPLVGLFAAFPAYNSIPNIAHQITKEPGEIVVTVKSKKHTRQGGKNLKRCAGYTLVINEFIPPFEQICVHRETYNSITIGSSLRLVGEKSRFGFSLKELYLDNPP